MEVQVSRGHLLPNIFYDVIVFLTPTLTFSTGLTIGFSLYDRVWKSVVAEGSATLSVVVGILLIFIIGYEFGRLAETFSDLVVGKPIRFLGRKKILCKNPDFQRDLSKQVLSLGIAETLFSGRIKSKWSLYFFALEHAPYIGADLLKRYAWEKLARSASFAFFSLGVLSVCFVLFNVFAPTKVYDSPPQIGSWPFLFACFFMYVVCLVDYYKRNCWNSDLLITTMPIIIDAVQRRERGIVGHPPPEEELILDA